MKRILSFVLLAALFLVGCATTATPISTPEPRSLTVFAAASLTDAFTEIGGDFEAVNPGVTVTFNFAGSQALRTQIEEGAPADVFASANKTEMDNAIKASFIAENAPQNFLSNKLVIILPADSAGTVAKPEDLANPGIKIVLAAEDVPVGKYARQALDTMSGSFGSDFKDKVLANVVSNEDNVKQVVAKIQLGEADAGIVYTSDAVAAPELKTIDIPAELNVIAKYPIAKLTQSPNADLADAFIAYVLSPDGQAVLQKWGFAAPQ
ncbi:MAG: molybdate ABC transporter substrate-binding protein [Anaerolineales bacterium]|nr:molybdate ABC transporter substrate-binding protein [Anaerolineales bacterium]MCB9111468.1 molybdate ABC transporter substrate-binding protein [Anaerolineales bacterium]